MSDPDDPLLRDLASTDPGEQSRAIKAMIERVLSGAEPWTYLLAASRHKYWRVRLDVIEAVVKRNPADALELLHAFRNTSYHVSQQHIRDYIEARFEGGRLADAELEMAKDILDSLMHAPNVTEVSRNKDRKLLERLKGNAPKPAAPGNNLSAGTIIAGTVVVGTQIVGTLGGEPGSDAIPADVIRLAHLLDAHFDLSELRALAFDVGWDWGNLRGETKIEKAQQLALSAQRSDKTGELKAAVARVRPNLSDLLRDV